MNFNVIATGSRGNCLSISKGPFNCLIDIGVSYSAIKHDPFRFVFLTHEHSDHLNLRTVAKVAKERPTTFWLCGSNLAGYLISAGVDPKQIMLIPVEIDDKLRGGEFTVIHLRDQCMWALRVPLKHDVPNYGWKIYFDHDSKLHGPDFYVAPRSALKVFYATDTADLSGIEAKDFDYYFVESNYRKKDIMERIAEKRENGGYIYEDRVLRTHMSKETVDKWLADNLGYGSTYVYLHRHVDERED